MDQLVPIRIHFSQFIAVSIQNLIISPFIVAQVITEPHLENAIEVTSIRGYLMMMWLKCRQTGFRLLENLAIRISSALFDLETSQNRIWPPISPVAK